MFVADAIAAAVPKLLGFIDKFVPDKDRAQELKFQTLELQQNYELKIRESENRATELENRLLEAQARINEIEATSDNLFKSGWRPFLAWSAAIAFIYQFIIWQLLSAFLTKYGYVFPELNSSEVFSLIFGLLGLAGVRSFDKLKGLTGHAKR